MSLAVCLQCGATKHGALVPCVGCGHVVAEIEDRAWHLIVADDLDPEGLSALSAHIASGGSAPEPDPGELVSVMAAVEQATPVRVALFALAAGGAPLAVALLTLLALAWLAAVM